MAEALDSRLRYAEPTAASLDFDSSFDEPLLVTSYTSSAAPRQVPARALAGAVLTWLAVVYGLCYLALPLLAAALGLHTVFLGSLILNTLAFVPMALLTAGLASAIRPDVVTKIGAPRDPIVAATAGGLLVWFGAHELSPVLSSILTMPAGEMLSFVTMNVIETSMIGAMLASFARTPGRAFALGAAFQTLLVAFFLGWLI